MMTFDKFNKVNENTTFDIASSAEFQKIVKDYNLKVISSKLQQKRGVVKVELSELMPINVNSYMHRYYIIYPKTGTIRGEIMNPARYSKPKNQYIIYRSKEDAQTTEGLLYLIKRFGETIKRQTQYIQDVKVWKEKLKHNKSEYTKAKPSVLRVIDHSLHDKRIAGIVEKWADRIRKDPKSLLKCPDYIEHLVSTKVGTDIRSVKHYYERLKKNLSYHTMKDIPERIFFQTVKFYLELHPDKLEKVFQECPDNMAHHLLSLRPKLSQVAKFGVFDN